MILFIFVMTLLILGLFRLKNWHRHILRKRDLRARYYRRQARVDIKKGIKELIDSGKLIDRGSDAPIRYVGTFGSTEPDVIFFYTAGVHGNEYFAIQSLIRKIASIDVNELVQTGIQVVCVPIVNQWGFENCRRTTKNRVDLVRNSSYRSQRRDVPSYPLVRGWKSWWIKTFICPLFGQTWYYMGHELEPELIELDKIVDPILHSNCDIWAFDFHTGNNRAKTTIWRHDLDQREYVPNYLRRVLLKEDISFGKIDYAIDGGIHEYFHLRYQEIQAKKGISEKNRKTLNAFTFELAVLDAASNAKYRDQYFNGSVFEPHPKERETKLEREVKKLSVLFEAVKKRMQLKRKTAY